MLINYKELNVWQTSYSLWLHLYNITKGFPKDEMYGLTSQIRRSAVSIPSNIAEGYGKKTVEYVRYLYIAYGSVCEPRQRALTPWQTTGLASESELDRIPYGEDSRRLRLESSIGNPNHDIR